VKVGVEQGCLLTPVIFNLSLFVVALACRNGLPTDAGVPFIYCLDRSLFNLRRLKAATKISNHRIYELQYADDTAIPAHSATGLQSSLDTLSTAYRRAGLVVNAKKTEVVSSADAHDSFVFPSLSMEMFSPNTRVHLLGKRIMRQLQPGQ